MKKEKGKWGKKERKKKSRETGINSFKKKKKT